MTNWDEKMSFDKKSNRAQKLQLRKLGLRSYELLKD